MIRALDTVEGTRAAAELFRRVWDAPFPQVTAELMRAVEHAGGYVAGAYDGDVLVGASCAFFGRDSTLHSHITGVVPEARARGVGLALKWHQRAWALERGVATVTWTFDPLVRRNAWFNVARLGAVGVAYLVDFYGPMNDALNAGEPSDRLEVHWHLNDPCVLLAAEGAVPQAPADGVVVLDVVDGAPRRVAEAGDRPALVRLPEDVEALRADDPAAARAWRLAVRDVLAPLLAEGRRVDATTRDGCLVVR